MGRRMKTETEIFYGPEREYDACTAFVGPNWSGRIQAAFWIDAVRCVQTREEVEEFSEFLLKAHTLLQEFKKSLT